MVTEPVLNTVLAEYLRKGLARVIGMPETRIRLRKTKGTRQPDIQVVDVFGIAIVVQGKIGNLTKAIEDCKEIINQGLADICFAVAYPKKLAEIEDILEVKRSLETDTKLEVALVKPPTQLTLTEWPLDSLKDLGLLTASELLAMFQGETIYDEIVGEELAEQVATGIERALDTINQVRRLLGKTGNEIAEILGISLKAEDENFGLSSVKLALFAVFNAMIVHEALASLGRSKINPLSMKPSSSTTRDWLINEWTRILNEIDYEPVFLLSVKLLQRLPSHPVIEQVLTELAGQASRIVASKALLKHDIAGRVYHTLLLRKVAKGLATYYTSIPGAYLLAKLAVDTPGSQLPLKDADKSQLVVADLACGSGTLLSAAYSAILDRWVLQRLEDGLTISNEDIENFHRNMLQNCIYGFDVLEYATHLAAAWLTLRMPEVEVRKLNIFTLPLGHLSGEKAKPGTKTAVSAETYLGSLSMSIKEKSGVITCVFPLATSLTQEALPIGPIAIGLDQKRYSPVTMPQPNLIIMNPPFARTGNVGKSILFGHLAKNERKVVLRKLKVHLKTIAGRLGGAVGKAGLAAPFVWLAHLSLADNGRLALVLPRVAMSGSSWESIRKMLGSKYQIDHIVVCYDPRKNWAWSENTVLSEILLVCTKRVPATEFKTKVTYVYHRPRSSLEAKILAARIIEAQNTTDLGEERVFTVFDRIRLGQKTVASCYSIPQEILARQRNWNVCAGFASAYLSELAWRLVDGNMFLGRVLPLVSLNSLVLRKQITGRKKVRTELMIGFDVHTFQRDRRDHGGMLLDVLQGANVETLNRLEVQPNTRMAFASDSQISSRMSNFLVAGMARLWLNTVGLISVYCKKPAVSNTMWTVQLQPQPGIKLTDLYKLQVLWLNSTPGLLGFLALRQDSKGAFIQYKREYLPLLKLLDTRNLNDEQLNRLLALYDELKNTAVKNLPGQLEEALNREGFRHQLDTELLQTLCPTIDNRLLLGIYRDLLNETIIRIRSKKNDD
jgi:hypothetical protein